MRSRSRSTSPSAAPNGPTGAARVQSLKIGTIAQILPLVAGYGVNLLATPYVVVQLGLHDYGVWAMTGAIAQYAGLLNMGMSRAANRYVALFHAQGDTEKDRSVVGICVTVVLGIGALLCAIAGLFAGVAEKVLRTGDSALIRFLLLCAATTLTCGLLAKVLAAASFGRGRQLPPNIGLAVLGAAQVLGGVVALAFAATLRSFAFGSAVGAAIGLCAVAVAIVIDEGRITIGRPRVALAREIIAFSIQGQAVSAADVVLFQSGKLIAGIVIGPTAAGAYELGMRLVQAVQGFGGAAAVAMTTHLTRTYATAGMAGVLGQYSRLTQQNAAAAIFLPFLLGTTSFSAIPLWLGGHHEAVVTVVAALAVGIAVNVSTGACSSTVFAIGRSGIIGATAVVSATMAVVLAIPLAVAFGFNGLVAAFASWIAIGNLLGVWFLQSRIGISMRDFLGAISGPFAVAILASIVALPINLIAAPDDRAHAIAPFFLSSAVFCAVYVTLGWRLDYLPRVFGRAQSPRTPTKEPQHRASTNGKLATATPPEYTSAVEARDSRQ
jgi:O-antigen/teichoic acid export membrane protein